ncbi:MAG: hypothetical protein HYU99_06415 [Deltaproteobacteria bacterium]|nr:hypothetical protein [Deltaproteobacteria bacterium]
MGKVEQTTPGGGAPPLPAEERDLLSADPTAFNFSDAVSRGQELSEADQARQADMAANIGNPEEQTVAFSPASSATDETSSDSSAVSNSALASVEAASDTDESIEEEESYLGYDEEIDDTGSSGSETA